MPRGTQVKTSRLQVPPHNSSSVLSSSDSKIHVANMGPTWDWQDSGGPYVGPMNLAIRDILTASRRLDIPIATYSISSSMFPVDIWNPPGGEYVVYSQFRWQQVSIWLNNYIRYITTAVINSNDQSQHS